jgi:hypothetical protein
VKVYAAFTFDVTCHMMPRCVCLVCSFAKQLELAATPGNPRDIGKNSHCYEKSNLGSINRFASGISASNKEREMPLTLQVPVSR